MNKKLSDKLLELDKSRKYFKNILNQYSEPALLFVPEPGHWNSLQVVDHLVKVEQHTLKFVQKFDFARKDEKVGLKNVLYFLLLKIALKSNKRFKIPTKEIDPELRNVADLFSEWEAVENDLKDFLNDFSENRLHNFIFFHPRSGKLNILQSLDFLLDHMNHHQKQIKRIIKNKKFPTA